MFCIFISIIFLIPQNRAYPVDSSYLRAPFYSLISDTTDTLNWHRPRFSERAQERRRMAKELADRIENEKVLEALRHVPRHYFVPEQYQEFAYENRPLPIGYEQTISQPFIVAYMTQLLNLQPDDKVLEIGTGSGYQAAVLSEMTPKVFTIEIVEDLGVRARDLFKSLGYKTIETKIGDGYRGWKKHAPFDAIILTAAPESIPQPLIEQLKPGGVLVAPVGPVNQTQMLTKIKKMENGELRRENKLPVRFVPMTGDDHK